MRRHHADHRRRQDPDAESAARAPEADYVSLSLSLSIYIYIYICINPHLGLINAPPLIVVFSSKRPFSLFIYYQKG